MKASKIGAAKTFPAVAPSGGSSKTDVVNTVTLDRSNGNSIGIKQTSGRDTAPMAPDKAPDQQADNGILYTSTGTVDESHAAPNSEDVYAAPVKKSLRGGTNTNTSIDANANANVNANTNTTTTTTTATATATTITTTTATSSAALQVCCHNFGLVSPVFQVVSTMNNVCIRLS